MEIRVKGVRGYRREDSVKGIKSREVRGGYKGRESEVAEISSREIKKG